MRIARRFTFRQDPHRRGLWHAVPRGEEDAHWCGDGVECGCGEQLQVMWGKTYVVHARVVCPPVFPEAWAS